MKSLFLSCLIAAAIIFALRGLSYAKEYVASGSDGARVSAGWNVYLAIITLAVLFVLLRHYP